MGGGSGRVTTGMRGVSPVIGTILLLGIVLILGVMVGGYTLGFFDDAPSESPKAKVDIELDDHGPYLKITHATLVAASGTEYVTVSPTNESVCVGEKRLESAGDSVTFGCTEGDEIVVVAHTESNSVLVDRYEVE